MAFATENDLVDLLPSIYNHGVADWSAQITKAETDIKDIIKSTWYDKRYNDYSWDETKLVEAQWTDATLYRALYRYILPQLSQFRVDGDTFQEMMKYYKSEYKEEMNEQFSIGIKYDRNADDIITNNEIHDFPQTRIWR